MRLVLANRWFKSLLAGCAVALIAGSAVTAQDPPRDRTSEQERGETRAPVAVDAPNARMVALIRSGGVLIMSKGVESVTRIAAGVYCIKPEAGTGIDPRTAVAVVSVEYFYSFYNESTVQWARRGHDCGNDRFGVYTFADRNLDAVYSFSNTVGFVIYVP
jgi:hypothetical protein